MNVRAACALSVLLALSPGLAEAASVAVVNLPEVMQKSADWKKAWGVLEKKRDARQKVLDKKRKEIEDKQKKLEAQRALVDPKQLATQEAELLQDMQTVMQSFMQEQQALAAQEKKLTDEMLLRMTRVVQELASTKDYDFIFELGRPGNPNVLYAQKGLDITAQVSKLYKKRFAKTPLKP